MRSTLLTFTKHTMGRVRRRTSTKQRSMRLVVRSFLRRCRGKLKNDSNSGRSRSSCRTMEPYSACQRRRRGVGMPLPASCHCSSDSLYGRGVAALSLADGGAARSFSNRRPSRVFSRCVLLLRVARLCHEGRRSKYHGVDNRGQCLERRAV